VLQISQAQNLFDFSTHFWLACRVQEMTEFDKNQAAMARGVDADNDWSDGSNEIDGPR
jgi:hypothetical protein